jgi:diguanylate cyclase (GGDEF)-like protein
MRRPRATVARRILLLLGALTASSTGLALALQDRALSGDLERAADVRLTRAANAAGRLIEFHLRGVSERYAAVSRAPELRANLEVAHAPTLAFYAKQLAEQQGAALVLFASAAGRERASAGDPALAGLARAALAGRDQALLAHDGELFAAVAVPLATGGRPVGRLLAVEPIGTPTLASWSQLCGASVSFGAPASDAEPGLVRRVRQVDGLELRVRTSLEDERHALANSRRNLLTGGIGAVALALGAGVFLAEGLVRPIRRIQDATERIGRGDLGTRLRLQRRDEIGDVARGFDGMLDRLEETMGRLRESEARLAGAQRLARLGSFSLAPGPGELHASAELRRILGLAEDAPLDAERLLARIHAEDRPRLAAAIEGCLRDGTPFELDVRGGGAEGERILHAQGERLARADGAAQVEGTLQDVTDRKLVEEQVRYLAYHDSLTSLGNRRLFQERLALALDDSRRGRGALAVLSLDLDAFQLVNDTLGHSAGDRLLKGVADRLVQGVRASTGVPGAAASRVVARLGGDEFAILLAPIRGPEDAARAARAALRALAEPFALDGHDVAVRASIGITTSPPDGDDVETLLRNADTALHHAKEQGRNHYQFFAESMNAVVFRRLVVESRLRRALERDELELHYQPKLELATGEVSGFEGLARWRDPELGFVSPSVFVPLAEEAGLIVGLGEWALRRAARDMAAWSAAGLRTGRVSVNLSGHQLREPSLVARTLAALQDAGVDPSRLELEITESALLHDEEAAMPMLEELRRLGIRIALDDFGTGYSSLSYLLRIPADTLKIDRSFLARIDREPADAALVGSILSMAKLRGLRVVAEGVESEEQLAVLRELGCDEVQGHLISAAVPAQEVPRLLVELAAWTAKPDPEDPAARRLARDPQSPRTRPRRAR